MFSGYAQALTAEDVTKRMTQEHRKGFLDGLLSMLVYQTAVNGDREKGNCIVDQFYRSGTEGMEKAWGSLLDVLDQYPDRRPEVLVTVLARQLCGE